MTRPVLCACGRYIKPRGFASHKVSCPQYVEGLRDAVDTLPRAGGREVAQWPEVRRRLAAGEAMRTGWTFNHKGYFANGDTVPDALMRRHRAELLQDANGNVTLDPEVAPCKS